MFGLVFSKRKRVQIENARRIFDSVNTLAREKAFFVDYKVPDTMTGRFDLITLIASFIVIRLNQVATKDSQKQVQIFFDVMFRQFDHALREGGIGDLSVPKHMKRMMQGFHGRAHAYDMAFVTRTDDEGEALSKEDGLKILARNLYSEINPEKLSDVLPEVYNVVNEIAHYIVSQDEGVIMSDKFTLPELAYFKKESKSAA